MEKFILSFIGFYSVLNKSIGNCYKKYSIPLWLLFPFYLNDRWHKLYYDSYFSLTQAIEDFLTI